MWWEFVNRTMNIRFKTYLIRDQPNQRHMFAEYPLPLNLMLSEKASVSNLDTVTANLVCEVFVDILSPCLLMHGIIPQRKPQMTASTSFPLAHFHQSRYQFISC
jgi:hypothetical protein